MTKKEQDLANVLLRDKKLKLQHLQEEHRIAIAVYNAKREMLMADIDALENHFYKDKK